MTTVGYGDITPISLLARILSLTAALAGLMLTAIMISIVQKELALSAAQGHTVKRFLLLRVTRKYEQCAASLVVIKWQLIMLNRAEAKEKQARAALLNSTSGSPRLARSMEP